MTPRISYRHRRRILPSSEKISLAVHFLRSVEFNICAASGLLGILLDPIVEDKCIFGGLVCLGTWLVFGVLIEVKTKMMIVLPFT